MNSGDEFLCVPPWVLKKYPNAIMVEPEEVRSMELQKAARLEAACVNVRNKGASLSGSDLVIVYSNRKLSIGYADHFSIGDEDGDDALLFQVVWCSVTL